MKKLLIIFLLTLLAASTCQAEDLNATICEYSKPAVVTVRAGDKTGSGFFINSDGYILTNAHVVKDEKKLKILLVNKTELPAEIVAIAEKADVALLKVAKTNVPVLRIGESKKMRQADPVLILGAPQGLSFTASRASIGATEREENGVKYIQIDGPVNPGNSGGPVINMRGEVVGITTAMLKNAQSIGFALPIDTVYEFLKKQPVTLDVPLDNELMSMQGSAEKKAFNTNKIDAGSGIGYALLWLVLSWASLSFNAVVIIRLFAKRRDEKRRREIAAEEANQESGTPDDTLA